ncbi:MAG TPA: TetR/AcrR family transcriptional regulator [Solirubrobacteraceae bacterium]|jgi:AcrR family transcriptional regulator
MSQVDVAPGRRRRRSAEEAEREIIEAAEGLLRERPFRELTVDEVMRRTGLSRPSFYVHFRDRHALVLRVVQHIEGELFTMSDRWYKGSGDGPSLVREALEGVVAVYERHGHVLRALSDAASDHPEVELAYGTLVESFVAATCAHIEEEIGQGEITGISNPREVARALVRLNEGYLGATLGRRDRGPEVPIAEVTDTLAAVWCRTLYGRT